MFIKRDDANVTPLYLEERPYDPFRGDLYIVPAYFRVNPYKSELTKFGINEDRDIKFIFSTQVLAEGGMSVDGTRIPFPEPKIGTVFEFLGDTYVATDIIPQDYFGNDMDDFMTLAVYCVKERNQSMKDQTFAVETDPSEPPVSENYREDLYS